MLLVVTSTSPTLLAIAACTCIVACRFHFDKLASDADVGVADVPAEGTGTSRTVTISDRPTSDLQGVARDAVIVMGAPGSNFGGSVLLSIHRSGEPADRTLLYFDVSTLAGAHVTRAQLQLVMLDTGDIVPGGLTIQRLEEAWSEGALDGTAGAGVTWVDRDTSIPWTTSGGTSSQLIAAVPGPIPTSGQVEPSLDLAVVQAWLDAPAQNFGMVIDADPSGVHYHFHARESSTLDARPQLLLDLLD